MDKRGVLKMREIIIASIFILLSVSAQSENFSGIKSAIEEAVTSGDMKMSIGLHLYIINGALGRIRTCDRSVRSRVLYPAELRVRFLQVGQNYMAPVSV